jgi:hypothetical protein
MSAPQKQGPGCLKIGCFILLAILLLLGVAGGLLAWKAWRLTSPARVEMPAFTPDPARHAEFKARLAAFQKAVKADQAASLEISADDLNSAIALEPQWKELRGRVFFRMDGGVLSARLSAPLNSVPLMKGRWLNADAGLAFALKDGEISLALTRFEMNGQAAPEHLTRNVSRSMERSFSDAMYRDREAREALRRVERVQVEGNRLVIATKGKAAPPPPALPSPPPAPVRPPPTPPPEAVPAPPPTAAAPAAPAPLPAIGNGRYVGRKLEDVKRELGTPTMTREEGDSVVLEYPKVKIVSADGVTVTAEKVEE